MKAFAQIVILLKEVKNMNFRKTIGKITSPVFVPLRRLIAWTDDKFGTCDHQLVLQPRACFLKGLNDLED